MEFITIYGMLGLPCKAAPQRASVRCPGVQARSTAFLDGPSVTLDAFQPLVPPCEAASHAPMAVWRLAGQPPDRPLVARAEALPLADAGRAAVLPAHPPEDLRPPGGARALVRPGPEQNLWGMQRGWRALPTHPLLPQRTRRTASVCA
jgi:hypothetical protein